MLDTVKISLDSSMFVILDKSKFVRDIMNSSRGYFSMVQNPTKKDMLNGDYKPRLTITHRYNCSGRNENTLSIEASMPKLLFGNNFDELADSDFEQVVQVLNQKIKSMGIGVWGDHLANGPISAIHYSKNIPLADGVTPHQIIRKIRDSNMPQSLDVDEANYRDGGYGYKWHASSYEIAFYDKIHDLEKAKKFGNKRAEENDNEIQLSLLDELDSFRRVRRLEVLRFEMRLNQRQKIKKLLNNLDIAVDMTFRNLFSRNISQKVLVHYWDEIERKRPRILDIKADDPNILLDALRINNPKLGISKCMEMMGLRWSLGANTPRELRSKFDDKSSRSWHRFMKLDKNINFPEYSNPLKNIRDQLGSPKPLKLVDFQDRLINNDKYN